MEKTGSKSPYEVAQDALERARFSIENAIQTLDREHDPDNEQLQHDEKSPDRDFER